MNGRRLTNEVNEMEWYQRFSRALLTALERSGRARTLAVLRNMDPKLLRETGFSPELIQQGINAWPWRVAATAIDAPQVPSLLAESPDLVSETDHMASVDPAERVHGSDEATAAQASGRSVDQDVAA
jgi:hypothetical protein